MLPWLWQIMDKYQEKIKVMPRLALLHSINHLVSAPTSLDKAIDSCDLNF
jgi:hypothetical protein